MKYTITNVSQMPMQIGGECLYPGCSTFSEKEIVSPGIKCEKAKQINQSEDDE